MLENNYNNIMQNNLMPQQMHQHGPASHLQAAFNPHQHPTSHAHPLQTHNNRSIQNLNDGAQLYNRLGERFPSLSPAGDRCARRAARLGVASDATPRPTNIQGDAHAWAPGAPHSMAENGRGGVAGLPLLKGLLCYNPERRLSCAEALRSSCVATVAVPPAKHAAAEHDRCLAGCPATSPNGPSHRIHP